MRSLLIQTAVLLLAMVGVASAEVFWGLTTDLHLVRFSDTAPGTMVAVLPITGLAAGEQMLAIKVLFDGTFIGITSTGRIYTLDRYIGAATPLAAQTGHRVVPSGNTFEFSQGELLSDT